MDISILKGPILLYTMHQPLFFKYKQIEWMQWKSRVRLDRTYFSIFWGDFFQMNGLMTNSQAIRTKLSLKIAACPPWSTFGLMHRAKPQEHNLHSGQRSHSRELQLLCVPLYSAYIQHCITKVLLLGKNKTVIVMLLWVHIPINTSSNGTQDNLIQQK